MGELIKLVNSEVNASVTYRTIVY